MISSKDATVLRMFFVHDYLGDFGIWNQSTVENGGVSRGRSVAVGVSDRWKVTCDTRHKTCDMGHVTRDM